jgi:hypothetical protein
MRMAAFVTPTPTLKFGDAVRRVGICATSNVSSVITTSTRLPCFTFGAIADIQYADTPVVGKSFFGRPRHYKDALRKVSTAVDAWATAGCSFGLNLGDIIDRRAESAAIELQQVLDAFHGTTMIYHCIGNHELSSLPRDDLIASCVPGDIAAAEEDGAAYYHFSPVTGWRVLVLDTYDLASKAWPAGHPKDELSRKMLKEGRQKEAVQFLDHQEMNGGVGPVQIEWLQLVLAQAVCANEKVIIATHCPLYPTATVDGYAVCWNYKEVLEVLWAQPIGQVWEQVRATA